MVTRIHSSRMHTVRCSSHLGGSACEGSVCPGGVCLPGVVSACQRVSACGGVCLGVSTCQGIVCLSGGVCLPGVSACQGVYTFPNGQTDTCENITFLQLLLRTVISRIRVTLNYFTMVYLNFLCKNVQKLCTKKIGTCRVLMMTWQ